MRFWLEINGEEFPGVIQGTIKRELGRDCVCTVCEDDDYWHKIEDELPKIGDDVLIRYRTEANANTYDTVKILNQGALSWIKAQVSHWVRIKAPKEK